jgi:hypothetical protein
MSVYISLFTLAGPVNYTSEFLEIFEAATYIDYTIKFGYVGHFNILL